jgi:hypothetical protein
MRILVFPPSHPLLPLLLRWRVRVHARPHRSLLGVGSRGSQLGHQRAFVGHQRVELLVHRVGGFGVRVPHAAARAGRTLRERRAEVELGASVVTAVTAAAAAAASAAIAAVVAIVGRRGQQVDAVPVGPRAKGALIHDTENGLTL